MKISYGNRVIKHPEYMPFNATCRWIVEVLSEYCDFNVAHVEFDKDIDLNYAQRKISQEIKRMCKDCLYRATVKKDRDGNRALYVVRLI